MYNRIDDGPACVILTSLSIYMWCLTERGKGYNEVLSGKPIHEVPSEIKATVKTMKRF